jgi:hypothetical protein
MAIAERIDEGALNEAVGNLMLAQLVSRINTDRLERDMAAAQERAPSAQPYETLLRGLGTWQSSVKPPVQDNSVLPSQPGQTPGKTPPAYRTPIICYQDGPRIACQ